MVVIGAGHNGLAMSHELGQRGIEHVVLERGEVANAWRHERWDSLRLLTPNWMCRLPGHSYQGDDPDGYMSAGEVADFVCDYARRLSAPAAHAHAGDARGAVRRRLPRVDRRAATGRAAPWCWPAVPSTCRSCRASPRPCRPAWSQLSAHDYRHPQQLAEGGVLVVGASATGVQLAQEIQRSGRPVTIAVGEHVRLPRVYRGRDIQWWMLAAGLLDQRIEDVDDARRARHVPSPQLTGTPERATLDLNALRGEGVELVGRLAGIRDGKAQFSGSLRNVCALADLKMNRLLDAIDEWIAGNPEAGEVDPVERFAPTDVGASPRLGLTLGDEIRTVVWATGFRPDHSWLDVPVFDRKGALQARPRHRRRAGPVRARAAVPAPAQVELHARRRRRRARDRRAPGGAPRRRAAPAASRAGGLAPLDPDGAPGRGRVRSRLTAALRARC